MLDRFESIHERCSHFVFEGYYPSLLGKHIDTCQEKFDTSVVPTQSGHVYQICLPLLVWTPYDGLSSRKLVTDRLMQRVNILTCQLCFGKSCLYFRGLCQGSNASKTANALDIIIGWSKLSLLLPHDGMTMMMTDSLFMGAVPTSWESVVPDWLFSTLIVVYRLGFCA